MPATKVIAFGENPATATYADGQSFIERTRRQLDRMDVATPSDKGLHMTPEAAAEIRGKLDTLEASIREDLGII